LCGINWYDSIRFPALFGYEESDEEKRQIELTDGRILKMRDELVQKFQLTTGILPKWFHDRFKAYATMSDELRITDYNWNNSDYLINRKLIVREGGYKPNYKIGSRLSWVKVEFKEGYQNVSRSLCCGTVYSGK
jgi:type I restriction-modification system DNA methylase subunit